MCLCIRIMDIQLLIIYLNDVNTLINTIHEKYDVQIKTILTPNGCTLNVSSGTFTYSMSVPFSHIIHGLNNNTNVLRSRLIDSLYAVIYAR